MEGAVILKGFGLLLFGLLFIWLGQDGWRQRRTERISSIEAAILKCGGEDEHLPFNRWDRILAYAQPLLMLLFGPVMISLGLIIIFM